MDNKYIWLVIGELVVILVVVIARIIFRIIEKHKVNNILKFIDEKSNNKQVNDKFKECLAIIKENNKNPRNR